MIRIAILYICTGQYKVFWNDFYESFQAQFLPKCQKKYFVFTDQGDLCHKENVHIVYIPHQEWPYNTLMRFEFFLKEKKELESFDFIYFFNANMKCNRIINEQEILPDIEKGEKLIVAIHPLYKNTKSRHCPFERNPNSKAYIPYKQECKYIMGSLNGGEAKAYLSLIAELAYDTKIDLERGIVARVHDESYLNAFVTKQSPDTVRYLSPSYVYPMDLSPNYPAYISMLDKRDFFDVFEFKKCRRRSFLIRAFNKIKRYLYEAIAYLILWMKVR